MVLNKLDVDRGCNENLYGDTGTHVQTVHRNVRAHRHAHTFPANERISLFPDMLAYVNTFIQQERAFKQII